MLWKINKIKRGKQSHKFMHRVVWCVQANIKIWSTTDMIMAAKDIDQTARNIWRLKF